MPTFTITRNGLPVSELQLDAERIELGSANTCQLFIDDLLISLRQAAFYKTAGGFEVEPLARTPSFTINGQLVTQRVAVPPNARIDIEGYEIRVSFEAVATPRPGMPDISAPSPAPAQEMPLTPPAPQPVSSGDDLPPIPPPLPPDLLGMNSGQASTPAVRPEVTPDAVTPPIPPPIIPVTTEDTEPKTEMFAPPLGQLVTIKGPLKGRTYPLRPGLLRIGRDQEKNEIVIRTDARGELDKSISRRHASVIIEGQDTFVEDLGSVAGTFVNGLQIAPRQRIPLRAGDQLEIRSAKESTVFLVEVHGRQAQIPSAAPMPPPPPPLDPIPEPAPPPPRPEPAPPPRWEGPRYDSKPSTPPVQEDVASSRRRRRPARPGDGVNPFEQVAGGGGMGTMPVWVWFAAAAAVVIVIMLIVFLVV